MTALIVIASIILFFVIILNVNVRAEIRYCGGKLDVKVKYLFFTIFPLRKKDKPEKSGKRKKKQGKSSEDLTEDKEADTETLSDEKSEENENISEIVEEDDISESKPERKRKKEKKESTLQRFGGIEGVIDKIRIVWGFTGKRLKKLFKNIHLEGLSVDFVIAGEDAHKTAVTYGTVSAAVYNILSAVRALFKVTVKKISIVCDFERKEPVYDGEVRITLRLSVILSATLGILWGLLINYNKIKPQKSGQPEMNAAVQV